MPKQHEFTCGPSLVINLICFFKLQKFAFVKGNARYFNTRHKENIAKEKSPQFQRFR